MPKANICAILKKSPFKPKKIDSLYPYENFNNLKNFFFLIMHWKGCKTLKYSTKKQLAIKNTHNFRNNMKKLIIEELIYI